MKTMKIWPREALEVAQNFTEQFLKAEQKILLNGEADINNAIVRINAGAGGTESCDWAFMLQRMINRWAESKKMKVQVLDVQNADEAGIKSVTMLMEGNYAYGLLKRKLGCTAWCAFPLLIPMPADTLPLPPFLSPQKWMTVLKLRSMTATCA